MPPRPNELFGAAILSVGPGGQPVEIISPTWTGDATRGAAVIEEIESAGTPLVAKVALMPASEILSLTDGKLAQGRGYEVATRWLGTLEPDAIEAFASAFEARTSPLSSIIIHHCQSAATNIAPDATAFGMRQPHLTALIYAAWDPTSGDVEPHRRWARRLGTGLPAGALPRGYANQLPDHAADQIAHAFGCNAARQRNAKARYDPACALCGIPLPFVTDQASE